MLKPHAGFNKNGKFWSKNILGFVGRRIPEKEHSYVLPVTIKLCSIYPSRRNSPSYHIRRISVEVYPTTRDESSVEVYPTIRDESSVEVYPTICDGSSVEVYPTICDGSSVEVYPTTRDESSVEVYPTICVESSVEVYPTIRDGSSAQVFPATCNCSGSRTAPADGKNKPAAQPSPSSVSWTYNSVLKEAEKLKLIFVFYRTSSLHPPRRLSST